MRSSFAVRFDCFSVVVVVLSGDGRSRLHLRLQTCHFLSVCFPLIDGRDVFVVSSQSCVYLCCCNVRRRPGEEKKKQKRNRQKKTKTFSSARSSAHTVYGALRLDILKETSVYELLRRVFDHFLFFFRLSILLVKKKNIKTTETQAGQPLQTTSFAVEEKTKKKKLSGLVLLFFYVYCAPSSGRWLYLIVPSMFLFWLLCCTTKVGMKSLVCLASKTKKKKETIGFFVHCEVKLWFFNSTVI